MKNKLLAMLIAAAMTVSMMPAFAWADTLPEIEYIDKSPIAEVGGSSLLAQAGVGDAKFDPRSESWYRNIKVKNQGRTGTCWACATATAAEISYAKEVGSYSELSSGHLAYFMYNRAVDPLKNTSGDKNILKDGDWALKGGNALYTTQALANRTGMALESIAPSPQQPGHGGYNSAIAYKNHLTLQNCSVINVKTRANVKAAIVKYGAVVSSYLHEDEYLKGANYYYAGRNLAGNHSVAIVGWDDEYSPTNFANNPGKPGAWLVQNSWGTGFGDNGYMWLSYADPTFGYCGQTSDGRNAFYGIAVDMQPAETSDYVFEYDGNAYYGLTTLKKGDKVANVYTAGTGVSGECIKLDAVGLTTWTDGTANYDINVYVGVTKKDGVVQPTSGKKKASISVTTKTSGYYTFDLGKSLTIAKGVPYAIVVTAGTNGINMGTEYPEDTTSIRFEAKNAKNHSLKYSNASGKWSDLALASKEASARVKGYAKDGGDFTPNGTSLASVKAGKGQLTVKWSKQAYQTNGYQIRYSTKSDMSGAKTATVSKTGTVSKTIKKLKKGKKYYVQVRTYKTIDGKKCASSWSNSKSARVK